MTILHMLASAHLRCAVLVLAAIVLTIVVGCASDPEVVEVEVVEEVRCLPARSLSL